MSDADLIPQLERLDLSGRSGYLNRGSWRLQAVARHERSFAPEPRAQGLARAALREWLADLRPDRLDDVVLLGSELISNAVRHVVGVEGRTVDLHAARAPDRVRVEVCDGGSPFTPALRAPGAGGGFGLLLVDRLAVAWGVAPDQPSCTWFEVALD